MKKINLGIIALFLGSLITHAQTPLQNALPKVSPGSPEQTGFAKFGNYQVNLFTGLPDISIPLYEIKSGDLTLPISISYHASGIKVNDWGSWVGCGWTLNAGASITRKVMGLPDELQLNYLKSQTVRDEATIQTTNQTDLDYLALVNRGTKDCEPDIFSYNLPGKSGKFLFNQKDNYKPVTIPLDPVKIEMPSNTNFKLTNESGELFDFNEIENTSSTSNGSTSIYTSAWVITQMLSANKQDAINFSYNPRWGQVSKDIQDYISISDAISTGIAFQQSPIPPISNEIQIDVWVNEQKPNEITFANGKVVFTSGSDRDDGFPGQKSLSGILIQSKDPATGAYTTIKTIKFLQSYFDNGSSEEPKYRKRLRLTGIEILDKNNTVVEKYSFDYNTSTQLPGKLSRRRDFWGYFNDINNLTLVPQQTHFYQGTTNQVNVTIGGPQYGRDPNPDKMQAYMLKRITYPSGGYTDFEFETNQYIETGEPFKYAGGLRIKTIKSFDGINTQPIVKTYKYGENETNYGRKNFLTPLQQMAVGQEHRFIDYLYNTDGTIFSICQVERDRKNVSTYYSYPNVELEPYDGAPVAYKFVTEYIGDGTNNTGKTLYEFTDHPDDIYSNFMTASIFKPIVNTYHQNRGQLKHKTIFRKNTNGTYSKLAETDNLYQAYPDQWYNKIGLAVFKKVITYNPASSASGTDLDNPASNACVTDVSSYAFANYDIRSSDNRLIQSTETVYDENDESKQTTTTTTYAYENFAHLLPTKITSVNSKSETITSERKYPSDFPGTAPYPTMVALNILDKVVQEKNLKNAAQISLVQNKYDDQNNNNYLPSKIDYQLGSNTSETRAKFNNYDAKGNILDMQKSDDIKSSFQWGYNGMYPVAEVKNAVNDYKESIVTDQQQMITGITATANQTTTTSITKTIEVTYTGTVTIKLGNQSTTAETVTGKIIAFGITTNLSSVVLGGTNGNCESGSSTTFSGISSGTYTITIELTNSHPFGFCGNIYYPGDYTHTVITGSKNFFYNGFEEDPAAATANPSAGKRYKLGDYQVPFTKPNGKTCYVSYHYLQSNVWQSITKVFTDNMTLNEGDAIDEVRVVPNDVQIVTYTYEPLIGLTSKCDVNNHLSFYNYDSYGRLRTIKDEDGNILKLISYKYTLTNESAGLTVCTSGNCSGVDANNNSNKKCVNGSCETGVRVNDNTTIRANGTWRCRYHYKFSDGTTLPPDIIVDPLYIEINAAPCDL